MTPPETQYVVVLGATSDARLKEGEGLEIPNYPTPVGPATFRFLTRYEDRGFDANAPVDLWVDVRGNASSTITETVVAYGNAAMSFLPLMALSANAWIDDPEIRLAFDNTPGRREGEFLQSFTTPVEPGAMRFGRPLDRDATLALIIAIGTHGEGARLRRAAEQYRQALSNWLDGQEVRAIAHLWIAVETLTKVALRRECAAVGLKPDELAGTWGVDLRDLDGEVRRRIIFRGDADSQKKAREASDGLEHGYLDFGEIRELARQTRDATAGYVREAIFQFSDLDEPWRSRLLGDRYKKPLKSWIVRYLRGMLVGDVNDLAAPDQAYPKFDRTYEIKTLEQREDGNYHFEMEENFRASFSDSVQFVGKSFEVWGARDETAAEAEAAPFGFEVVKGGTEKETTTEKDTP